MPGLSPFTDWRGRSIEYDIGTNIRTDLDSHPGDLDRKCPRKVSSVFSSKKFYETQHEEVLRYSPYILGNVPQPDDYEKEITRTAKEFQIVAEYQLSTYLYVWAIILVVGIFLGIVSLLIARIRLSARFKKENHPENMWVKGSGRHLSFDDPDVKLYHYVPRPFNEGGERTSVNTGDFPGPRIHRIHLVNGFTFIDDMDQDDEGAVEE